VRRAQANRCGSVESGSGDVKTGGDPSAPRLDTSADDILSLSPLPSYGKLFLKRSQFPLTSVAAFPTISVQRLDVSASRLPSDQLRNLRVRAAFCPRRARSLRVRAAFFPVVIIGSSTVTVSMNFRTYVLAGRLLVGTQRANFCRC
jgi:hypothetical protein